MDLLDVDAAEPARAAPRTAPGPPSSDADQIFVATTASSRGSRALRERSLGAAVHRRRVDHPRARFERRADDLARRSSRVAAEGVPGSEADDRAEPPLLHQRTSPRASHAGREGGGEEVRVVVGAAAHVRERQPRAGLAPALRPPSCARATRALEPRPGTHVARRASARVWCETPRWRSLSSASETRDRDHRHGRRARAPRSPPRPRQARRGRAASRSRRSRGRSRRPHVEALGLRPRERRGRETHWTSPSKHGATATAVSRDRAPQRPHRVRERDRQRTARRAARRRRAARPARRRPARAGCAGSSRRPASRRASAAASPASST